MQKQDQKQCTVCKQWKNETEYYYFQRSPKSKSYHISGKSGLYARCKSCTADYNKAYHAKNHDEKMVRFYWNNYGLSQEDFDSLFSKQDGLCAICNKPFDGKPQVDHDHIAGYEDLPPKEKRKHVRGLLCACHNRMIGQGHDDPDELQAGAKYLREYKRITDHR